MDLYSVNAPKITQCTHSTRAPIEEESERASKRFCRNFCSQKTSHSEKSALQTFPPLCTSSNTTTQEELLRFPNLCLLASPSGHQLWQAPTLFPPLPPFCSVSWLGCGFIFTMKCWAKWLQLVKIYNWNTSTSSAMDPSLSKAAPQCKLSNNCLCAWVMADQSSLSQVFMWLP